MNVIQIFEGTLNRGFQGNIIYNFHLPDGLSALSVKLTHKKEHLADADAYEIAFGSDLLPLLNGYLERPASKEEERRFLSAIKTEIQLCLIIDGTFVGNVHMPGERKEMMISKDSATRGCLPCARLAGMAKIVINVFHVAEDQTPYRLVISGEYEEEQERTCKRKYEEKEGRGNEIHVEKN